MNPITRTSLLLGCLTLGFAAALHGATSADGKTEAEYVVSVFPDRPEALYRQGETVTFKIELQHHKAPAAGEAVEWVITKDEVPLNQKGTVKLDGGKATVTGTLAEPGFLHCTVTFRNGKTAYTAIAGAGFDPEQIKPSLPVPADFDAFWAEKKKKLAAAPAHFKMTPVPPPPTRKGAETFEFYADTIGEPVIGTISAPATGYYSRPTGAKPKSLPAVLLLPGAGVRSANLDAAAGWAANGMLYLDLNIHGTPNGQPGAYYGGLDMGVLKNYRKDGSESRETYYFLGAYYRVLRAIEFLTSQPEWDGRTLVMAGGSQGGGLALVAAGLEPRTTLVIAHVPGLADRSGTLAGRIGGWPRVVPPGPDGKPDPKVLEELRYFDSANFATRIKAPAHVEVGFLDVICPATCGYVAYNNIPGKKTIKNYPDRGHDLGPQVWSDMRKMILEHAAAPAKAASAASPAATAAGK